ncbi:MAG: hypothetical protein HKO62_08900, partial [Gammaproteobacteria bacterium]|nr:hypothetical protein [Gammaproteobacteria bacterium]
MPVVKPVVVPDLGDFADVEVIEVLVAPGDQLAPETPLVTLESDKATMDIPCPDSGEVVELKVSVGDRLSAGDTILMLREAADATAASEPALAADAPRADITAAPVA